MPSEESLAGLNKGETQGVHGADEVEVHEANGVEDHGENGGEVYKVAEAGQGVIGRANVIKVLDIGNLVDSQRNDIVFPPLGRFYFFVFFYLTIFYFCVQIS